MKRTKLLGGEATMTFDAAASRIVVTARLDLLPPVDGSVLCRVAAEAEPPLAWSETQPVLEGARVILGGRHRASVSLFEGGERLLSTDFAPSKGELELTCPRLGDAARLVVDDGTPRAWQLPGIAPSMRVRLPDGTVEHAELRAVALHVDLDARALALFWHGVIAVPRRAAGLVEDTIQLEAGFVPRAPTSTLTADFDSAPSPVLALPVDNRTGLVVTSFSWQLRPPAESAIVVVKGTFDLVDGAPARPSDDPAPLSGERAHAGSSSLAYPGDHAPFKPRADVIVDGHAYAKPGASIARVELRVGALVASLVALGPRRFLAAGHPSDPEPFDRVPLRWEHAFGGPDVAANPVGVGATQDASVPRIERPDELLRRRGDRPRPIGFGAIPPSWEPRAKKLGTYAPDWQKTRWPYFPADFDWSYWNAAPAELTVEALRGDAEYRITSVRPGGADLEGRLPGTLPRCFAVPAGSMIEVPLRLDTAVFDTDQKKVFLVWRGALELKDGAAPPRALLLIEDPIDAPRPMKDVERLLAANAARDGDTKVSRPSALLGEIREALAARRPLPASGGRSIAQTPAPPPAPRVSRGLVERWLATNERLAGRDLSGADLSGLDFSGRDLSGTVLRGAILDDATLDGALCEGLRATDLRARRSSWKGAKLGRADFARADLEGADLSGAVLDQTTFADAELVGLVARGAAGAAAQFVRARMIGAVFDDAKLPKIDLSHATLDDARFAGAMLDDAKLYEVLADGLVADRASLVDARFELARLARASFREARARGSMWERAALAGADFTGAVLAEAGFAGADLEGARLGGADLERARFLAARAAKASFVKANLMRASFEGADVKGADFSGANLYQAETWRARMEGAKLGGAFVKGTKIRAE